MKNVPDQKKVNVNDPTMDRLQGKYTKMPKVSKKVKQKAAKAKKTTDRLGKIMFPNISRSISKKKRYLDNI